MSVLRPSAGWQQRLRALADAPPARPRVPLAWKGQHFGSVEADLFARAGIPGALVQNSERGWQVQGELTRSLAELAQRLRDAGLAHAWRDEQLAVCSEDGVVLGTVERAVARPLGLATHAVHLLAVDAQGGHWVQQRAFDKPTDPGLWDTLVGGLVPASDTLEAALARETWEEAGLHLHQVHGLRHGGRLRTARPLREVPHGYMVETLDWYVATLPPGVVPANQDGEVAGFRCVGADEVTHMLEQGLFTIDAALVLAAAFVEQSRALQET